MDEMNEAVAAAKVHTIYNRVPIILSVVLLPLPKPRRGHAKGGLELQGDPFY